MNDNNLREIRIDGSEVFSGKLLHVFHDTVKLPNGNLTGRDLIRHVGAVCVVPITADGYVIMERQYRYPVDEILWEIPAGKLDDKNEDKLEAAKRELREETGYCASTWIDLGLLYPTPAYSDEAIKIYIAQDLIQGEQELDDDEFINVELIKLDKLVDMVMNGEIIDAKTQLAILKADKFLKNNLD